MKEVSRLSMKKWWIIDPTNKHKAHKYIFK